MTVLTGPRLVVCCTILVAFQETTAFVSPVKQRGSTTALKANSDLPQGISPFEKSMAKSYDVPGQLRKLFEKSFQQAKRDSIPLMEMDFPPLMGEGKTQFDDFDNISELDENRNFCIQLLPLLSKEDVWFILPDLKEVQLAKEEWTGQLYRNAKYTTIQTAVEHYTGGDDSSIAKPWGAVFANALQKATKNENMLGNVKALDDLADGNPPSLHLVCQPGNGGPVEDWINANLLHQSSPDVPMLIVNGALDKVRDGYYPALVFPALAKTVPFYRKFEPLIILKPISDKGVYGWLYRVYPEPWQVVLQTVKTDRNDRQYVENTVVSISDTRPPYAECVQKLLEGAAAAAQT